MVTEYEKQLFSLQSAYRPLEQVSLSDTVKSIRESLLEDMITFAVRRGSCLSEIYLFLFDLGRSWGIEEEVPDLWGLKEKKEEQGATWEFRF